MRFHQLPPGARFEYKGVAYRKLTSLTASPEGDGKTGVIPRSAQVTFIPEDGQHSPDQGDSTAKPAERFLTTFYRHCQHELETLAEGANADQISGLRQGLETLYQRLRQDLDQTSGAG